MSYTSGILNRALKSMQGVVGEIILADIKQTGLKKAQVEAWVAKLRKAADTLEELL
jgi:hypothetical protein